MDVGLSLQDLFEQETFVLEVMKFLLLVRPFLEGMSKSTKCVYGQHFSAIYQDIFQN